MNERLCDMPTYALNGELILTSSYLCFLGAGPQQPCLYKQICFPGYSIIDQLRTHNPGTPINFALPGRQYRDLKIPMSADCLNGRHGISGIGEHPLLPWLSGKRKRKTRGREERRRCADRGTDAPTSESTWIFLTL